MNKADFLRELEKIIEASPGTLDGREELSALDGWDSMAAMGFIAMVDSRLGVMVSPSSLAESRTVADLMHLAGVK